MKQRRKNEELLLKVVDEIKRIRHQRKITLSAFNSETDINMAKIESEKPNITLSTLKAVCDHLHISLADLFKAIGE